MLIPDTLELRLEQRLVGPYLAALPSVLEQWCQCDFEPVACKAALDSIIGADERVAVAFRPDAVLRGEYFATDEFMYNICSPQWDLALIFEALNGIVGHVEVPTEYLPLFADAFRVALQTDDLTRFHRSCADAGFTWPTLLTAPGSRASQQWPPIGSPGVYRREHSTLVVRSAKTTLVIDPVSMTICFSPRQPRGARVDGLDGIVMTHGHGDHWDLGSILHEAEDRTLPVLVPRVPRKNVLTRIDFAEIMGAIDQKVIVGAWGETVVIGDIEVDVLPFYGEQPSRFAPGAPPGIRSWGNCYRFNTPEFSLLLLVDSGTDPMGSMLEVAEASSARRGPVDFVISCMREFPSPFGGIFSEYFATLAFDQLRGLWQQHRAGKLPSTTLGIAGLAEVCAAARARYFLPYAHMFAGIGQVIKDCGTREGSEPERLNALRDALARSGCATAVQSWNSGDAAFLSNGQLVIRTPSELAGASRARG